MTIAERHLGLIPSNEAQGARERVDEIAARIAAQVDLDRLLAVAREALPLPGTRAPMSGAPARPGGPPVRLGIARDAAFGFYYPGDLDALDAAGAELVSFDALHAEPPAAGRRRVHRRRISGNAYGRARGEHKSARASCTMRSKPACRPMPSAAG